MQLFCPTKRVNTMVEQIIKTTLEQADEYFHAAQEELFKPEEDVVHYMVCKGAYRAIYNYLTSYLLIHDLTLDPKVTLKELLELCKNIDKKFNDLNLDLLYHAHDDEDVWRDLGIAQQFMDLATQTKKLVGRK